VASKTGTVHRIEFAGLRKTAANLRGANERSVVAAYRHGQMIDALRKTGYTYQELGEEIDRCEHTMQTYAKLYRKYADEKELIATARGMHTYNVAKLAGVAPFVPVQYVMRCTNCGSTEFKKHRKDKHDDAPASALTPKFAAPSLGATAN